MSDKIRLCKWSAAFVNEAVLCTLYKFPETKTMIFKADPSNPNADVDLPILLKDDPDIKPDKTTEKKRGYSGKIVIILKIQDKWLYLDPWNITFTLILILSGPCSGDSGSPLWSTKEALMNINGEVPEYRYILVAVYVGSYQTNKYFQPGCTSTAGRAIKITDKVLKWIRKNMQRVDT